MFNLEDIGAAIFPNFFTQQRRAEDALNNQRDAGRRANQIAQETLDFQKEQYAEWKAVFGGIQENLGEYYRNLGHERIASLGLQRQYQEYEQVRKQVKQNLARRGMGNSQFEDYTLANLDAQSAYQRAMIRDTAQDKANQQKMGFLSLGLQSKGNHLQNITQAGNLGVTTNTEQAANYANLAEKFNALQYKALNDITNSATFLATNL